MSTRPTSRCIAVALLMGAWGVAQAQAFDAVRLDGEAGERDSGRVGLVGVAAHQYLGSDERRNLLVPTFDYRWANGWFAGVGNGVGYRFKSSSDWQYGLRLAADFGRKEHRSSVLQGLGDIHARPEVGAFLNWQAARDLTLSSSLRYGSGNERDGLVIDVGAHYGLQLAPRWRLSAGVTATWVNAAYMQGYFGVTPEQSVRSGYAVSALGSGLRDVRAGAALIHFINRDWAATLAVTATSLQGDARDSVIVRERTPVSAIVGVGYRF